MMRRSVAPQARPAGPLPWLAALLTTATLVLAGCASSPSSSPSSAPVPAPGGAQPPGVVGTPSSTDPGWPQAQGQVLGRNDRLLVYKPVPGDSLDGIAARFLGGAEQAWQIADANSAARLEPGAPLVVPLRPLNPLGVQHDRLQTVPILCYHRLGAGTSKMVVSPANFEAQMAWLVRNDYRVIRLADLAPFLAGDKPLPQRSVVITFDDGYESVHRHALPILRKYGLPATVFVYTDFLGGGDALTWAQLQDMQVSGLVDVQSHSKSHRNLVERQAGETEDRYRANLDAEMRVPRDTLERRLAPLKVRHLAYPFGDANEAVMDSAARHGFDLAATVVPGGNAFFAQPLLLRRTMIFGDMSLDTFKTKLQTSRPLAAP
jgi:peptidoglycan/xylan/chitin deacetylase (PgdA/CDA1 family)